MKKIITIKIKKFKYKEARMNKGKQPHSLRVDKRIQKEVKHGMRDALATPPSKSIESLDETLKRYPKKLAARGKRRVSSMVKSMERKSPHKKKTSKRTSPKEELVGSMPAHTHSEGTRWMKTLGKQNNLANKLSTKKLAKRNGRR